MIKIFIQQFVRYLAAFLDMVDLSKHNLIKKPRWSTKKPAVSIKDWSMSKKFIEYKQEESS